MNNDSGRDCDLNTNASDFGPARGSDMLNVRQSGSHRSNSSRYRLSASLSKPRQTSGGFECTRCARQCTAPNQAHGVIAITPITFPSSDEEDENATIA
ncbi:hypothetical protein PTSG_07819 [Salpingoeca rosetta]|uniref:Uncharacterized protein n=1 Tax=Salpingoeca rosetta (strain ATCC 50818 / BSB-021) TaxID=946362 RepID=F2UGF2_SALR5|nr:uncharacterized protein PTSG_07819 [Salpingoeca rosetta]EGD75702.1 hypothetical protein PTSG_07819 [Salpingoeca rosetta]|eukprot:XP_004991623.1 hypothetical protein PTSG_07819 [Salpingoeca rosetta]